MIFKGKITKGIGRHSELYVPGYDDLELAPPDWPAALHPGSLNIRISVDGFPEIFDSLPHRNSVKNLDLRCVPPAFVIPQERLGNNKLAASPEMPHRGSGRVWRAVLRVAPHEIRCWVLRRFGSGLSDQLEIVSAAHLRDSYGLVDGQDAVVVLESGDA